MRVSSCREVHGQVWPQEGKCSLINRVLRPYRNWTIWQFLCNQGMLFGRIFLSVSAVAMAPSPNLLLLTLFSFFLGFGFAANQQVYVIRQRLMKICILIVCVCVCVCVCVFICELSTRPSVSLPVRPPACLRVYVRMHLPVLACPSVSPVNIMSLINSCSFYCEFLPSKHRGRAFQFIEVRDE